MVSLMKFHLKDAFVGFNNPMIVMRKSWLQDVNIASGDIAKVIWGSVMSTIFCLV